MSGTAVLLLLLLASGAMSVNGHRWDRSGEEPDEYAGRDGKFFSFFNIVRFSNKVCDATSDAKGTCYTGAECRKKEGRQATGCAQNFGSCCVFEYSCNKITTEKVAYFQNPKFSSKEDGPIAMCSFRVDIEDKDVCQVRLDFLDFEIGVPDNSNVCATDTFMITDSMGFDSLCGKNKGQHLYLPVDTSSGMSSVTMRFDIDSNSKDVIWNIQVKQIDCNANDPEEAPANCLQYHSDPSGSIQSFNFEGKQYFQNLNYAICIKRVTGTCKVEFEATEDDDFTLENKAAFAPNAFKVDEDCNDVPTSTDFLLIPQVSTMSTGKFTNLHCGDRLPVGGVPTTATSFGSGPIVLQFHTDNKATANEKGFNLKYKQSSSGC